MCIDGIEITTTIDWKRKWGGAESGGLECIPRDYPTILHFSLFHSPFFIFPNPVSMGGELRVVAQKAPHTSSPFWVTTPVHLKDRPTQVCNENPKILRMFGKVFSAYIC